VEYALALAQATLAQGRSEDAERMLRRLLERAQNDGAVNLTMARLLVAGGRPSEAKAFYHRAVYGRWDADSTARRNAARFELIGVLDIEGAHEEMLAELLPLQSDSADTVALLSRVGPLYLRADAPGRAAEAFRVVIRRSPDDARAWTGLGDAAIALGQFITARSAFRNAARVAPGDTVIAQRQRLADTLLALDPMARGLSDSERLERSQLLLARTLATVDECAPAESLPPPETRALRDTVIADLAARTPRREFARATDRKLALASALWRSRPATCAPHRDPRTEALHLLQQTLAR
jgi:Flp pilus assembly protein TadD